MTNEKEQLEFCSILDNWYLVCKSQFKGTHPLGMRKENLKSEVCNWLESKKFEKLKETEMKNKFIPDSQLFLIFWAYFVSIGIILHSTLAYVVAIFCISMRILIKYSDKNN